MYGYGETEDYLITITGGTPCPQTLTLVSPTDDQTTGTATKQAQAAASGKINASNKITGTGTTATYEARSIELQQGFSAAAGTVFKAQVGGCN